MLQLHEATVCSAFPTHSDTLHSICLALSSAGIAGLSGSDLSKNGLSRAILRQVGVENPTSHFCLEILGSDDLENGELMLSEFQAHFLEQYLGDPHILFVVLSPTQGQYVREIPMPDVADVAYWRGAIQLLSAQGPGLTIASPVGFDTEAFGSPGEEVRENAIEALKDYLRCLQLVPAVGGHEWDPVSSFGYRFLRGVTHPDMPAEYKALYRALFQIHAWGEVLSHACDGFFQENPFGLLFNDPEGITSMLMDDADHCREGSLFLACVYPEHLISVLRALMMQEKIMEDLWKSRSQIAGPGH